MSEAISDKEYIKMVVSGERKSSHIEVTPKSIFLQCRISEDSRGDTE